MKWTLLALALLVATAACGKKEESQPEQPKGSGVKDCDDYFAALESCSGKLPDAQRGPMQDELRKQKSAFDGADKFGKAQMRDTCRLGLATLKADQRCK